LEASKPKGINRIAIIGQGYLREIDLSCNELNLLGIVN